MGGHQMVSFMLFDAGHMPMWENPGALAEGIWGLIKRVG